MYICIVMAKLFIVGFPKDMEEIELVEMFSIYGTVHSVTIITDIDTGESKCYGFITMTDQQGAERAIEAMDGASIDDRQISVRFADDKNKAKPEPPKKVFQKQFIQQAQSTESTSAASRKKRPRRNS